MKWILSFLVLGLFASCSISCSSTPSCSPSCQLGRFCEDGRCRPFCKLNETLCADRCVNTRSNPFHCGACNNLCPGGHQCIVGQCAQVCPKGQELCAGSCADTSTSPAHCGACGNTCKLGQSCVTGKCKDQCRDGQMYCEGYCYDPKTSVLHCGKCGNACDKNSSCINSKCVKDGCGSNADCQSGEVCLQGSCLRLPTGRQEGEECTPQQSSGSGLCAPELTCFALKDDPKKGICFRRCEQDAKVCTAGRVCSSVNNYRLCLTEVDEGKECNVRKLTTCKPGLVCDESSKLCKKNPNAPPPLARCGTDALPACKDGEVCIKLNSGDTHGYCAKKCEPTQQDCAQKRFCFPVQSATINGVCLYSCTTATDCPSQWQCQQSSGQSSFCRP